MTGFTVEMMNNSDWPEVVVIYQKGIETADATFETKAPDWPDWDAAHLPEPRLVARIGNKVIGWAALSPVSDRCAYTGVAEVSVYVNPAFSRQGVGSALLHQLVAESEKIGIWTLQAGIFPENQASIILHHRLGFRTIGVREKLGKLNGVWRDVILLERRSKITGTS